MQAPFHSNKLEKKLRAIFKKPFLITASLKRLQFSWI